MNCHYFETVKTSHYSSHESSPSNDNRALSLTSGRITPPTVDSQEGQPARGPEANFYRVFPIINCGCGTRTTRFFTSQKTLEAFNILLRVGVVDHPLVSPVRVKRGDVCRMRASWYHALWILFFCMCKMSSAFRFIGKTTAKRPLHPRKTRIYKSKMTLGDEMQSSEPDGESGPSHTDQGLHNLGHGSSSENGHSCLQPFRVWKCCSIQYECELLFLLTSLFFFLIPRKTKGQP